MESKNKIGDSILPFFSEDENGRIESIICTSISGKPNFTNEMPKELELKRILVDGSEIYAKYGILRQL